MAIIALVGALIGVYLSLYKYGVIGEMACSIGSCERVQTSRWSVFLGLPVATWGIGFYVTVLVVALAGIQERFIESRRVSLALLLLTGWGVVFSSWLTYLEWRVIRAWCQWCVLSALLVLVLFLLATLDWRDQRAAPAVTPA